jgi:hypothetical protein
MDIRICPNCGILFDMDKLCWNISFGHIECPCCDMTNKVDNYELVKL